MEVVTNSFFLAIIIMRYFQILVAIFMIILLIGYLTKDQGVDSYACAVEQEFYREDYCGKVVNKFIDQNNHRFNTILLNPKKEIVLVRDTSGLYSFILKGDSIIKIKNREYLTLIRDGRIYNYKIYFGCDK